MQLTFTQMQDYVNRLPVTEANYYIFEALLRQPYDLYRPIMDMLFDGTIVVEDLVAADGAPATGAALADIAAARGRLALASRDATAEATSQRAQSLAYGVQPGAVVLQRDATPLTANPDGSPGSVYVPGTTSVVGADASSISPNPIELERAGSLEDAQKASQEAVIAAMQPQIA
jgi:hypothetical protein